MIASRYHSLMPLVFPAPFLSRNEDINKVSSKVVLSVAAAVVLVFLFFLFFFPSSSSVVFHSPPVGLSVRVMIDRCCSVFIFCCVSWSSSDVVRLFALTIGSSSSALFWVWRRLRSRDSGFLWGTCASCVVKRYHRSTNHMRVGSTLLFVAGLFLTGGAVSGDFL